MSPHISRQHVEEYRQRVLPEADLLAVDDHLAVCEECRQRFEENVDLGAVVSGFHRRLLSDVHEFDSNHISYEQLVKLVDDELGQNERDALRSHMEVCESCTEEATELRAFRVDLLKSTEEKTARVLTPSISEKIQSWVSSQRFLSRPAFVGAFTLLVIAVSVVLFLAWRASRRAQPELQAANPPSEAATEANSPNVVTAPSPSLPSTPDEQFVVTLNDGGNRVTLNVNGDIAGLPPLSGASNQAVRRALITGKVGVPDLSELIGTKGRLMGPGTDGSAFSLINPVGTVTRNTRPTLSWRPLAGATSYTVAIFDDAYNLVTKSSPLTTTSWALTSDLDRGRVYLWQVSSLKDGKEYLSPNAPEPEARFKVLDKATVDELNSIEKTSNSHLVRGTIYARAGLLEESEKELRALLAANPNSKLARELLESLQAKKRQ